jgi:hypothetical protein
VPPGHRCRVGSAAVSRDFTEANLWPLQQPFCTIAFRPQTSQRTKATS